ncbi:hypothetical protein OSTOST_17056, partial [Ostertagia ostertagi]
MEKSVVTGLLAKTLKVIPGSNTSLTSPEEAVKMVKEFGTPVILKPAHGTGKQAMQYVHDIQQIPEAFLLMSNTAKKLFGDGSIIVRNLSISP